MKFITKIKDNERKRVHPIKVRQPDQVVGTKPRLVQLRALFRNLSGKNKEGMKKSKYSYDQIRKLQMEGYSQVAIARILGISQSWLSGMCNKNSSKDYRFRIFEQPIDKRYWQSEDEIVQSLEPNYLPEQLSGWENAISLFPETKYTERLNLHYARMGDPIFNENVFEFSRWMIANKKQIQKDTGLRIEVIHPVLTTSLPVKFQKLEERILEWCDIKNNLYNGQAGLQFSINSTDEAQRTEMYRGMQMHLEDFARIAEKMPEPVSRKYCLNFAFSTDFVIDADKVANLFDPEKFMCKITPIHNNTACVENGIKTVGGYDSWKPYQKPEEELKAKGFDVLVFVPSIDEEDGLVTCGNAILGGSKLKYDEDLIKIEGLTEAPYTT